MSLLPAWLVPRVARKHHPVQAPGPGLAVVFLTFLVLAQGGGGGAMPPHLGLDQKRSQYPLGAFPPQGPTQHTAAGGSGHHECPLTPPPPDPPSHALVRHIRQVGGRARPASARTPQKGDANAEHTPQPRPNSERCPGVTGPQCPEPPGLVPRPSPGGRREEHFAIGH